MAATRLRHYLRKHRKCNGLSQKEVTFLLGSKSSAKLSRYENFAREPSLKTALALSVIYNIPPHELFSGLMHEIDKEVRIRVEKLEKQLVNAKFSKKHEHKCQHLLKLKSPRKA